MKNDNTEEAARLAAQMLRKVSENNWTIRGSEMKRSPFTQFMATPIGAGYTLESKKFDLIQEFINNVEKEILRAPKGKAEGKDGLLSSK